MEIKIKTAQELRDQHVTISIEAVPGTSWSLSDQPYTVDEVADSEDAHQREIKAALKEARTTIVKGKEMVEEVEDAWNEERERAKRAEAELARRTGERDERERARAGLEAALAAARQTIDQLTADLEELQTEVNAQNDRANQNKMWAERAEARLVVVENDRAMIQKVNESRLEALDKVRAKVWNDVIGEALSPGADPRDYVNILCRAMRDVREIVGKTRA